MRKALFILILAALLMSCTSPVLAESSDAADDPLSGYYHTWKVTGFYQGSTYDEDKVLFAYGNDPSLCVFPDGTLELVLENGTTYILRWDEYSGSIRCDLGEGIIYSLDLLEDGRMVQALTGSNIGQVFSVADDAVIESEDQFIGRWNNSAATITGVPISPDDSIYIELNDDHSCTYHNSETDRPGSWSYANGVVQMRCEGLSLDLFYTGLGDLLSNLRHEDGTVWDSMLFSRDSN